MLHRLPCGDPAGFEQINGGANGRRRRRLSLAEKEPVPMHRRPAQARQLNDLHHATLFLMRTDHLTPPLM